MAAAPRRSETARDTCGPAGYSGTWGYGSPSRLADDGPGSATGSVDQQQGLMSFAEAVPATAQHFTSADRSIPRGRVKSPG